MEDYIEPNGADFYLRLRTIREMQMYLRSAESQAYCLKCQFIQTRPKDYITHCERHNTKNDKIPHHEGNGKHKGLFAGTITLSPTWGLNEEDMVQAIKKIFSQQTCPVKRYIWYLEFTKANQPHIHFIYETESGGRIHQKVFERYWKKWNEEIEVGKGHRGGYHESCHDELKYKEYIEKDKGRHVNKWSPNPTNG